MPCLRAFSDELQKIANAGRLAHSARGAAQGAGKSFMGEFWAGGRLNKAMSALGAVSSIGEAMPAHDPRGQDRSRSERLLAAPGGIVGGTMGSVLGSRLGGPGWKGLVGGMVGGIAGGAMGENATSAPLRRARLNRQAYENAALRQQQAQQPPAPMPGSGVPA